MKKFLLLAAAALVFTGANAQLLRGTKTAAHFNPQKQVCNLQSAVAPTMEMKQATAEEKANYKKAPKKAGYIEPYYLRPAGAFFSPFIAVDGCGFYSYGDWTFLLTKPFADYTWKGDAYGDDGSYTYVWQFYDRGEEYFDIDTKDLTYSTFFTVDDAPIFNMVEGDPYSEDSKWYSYQMKNYVMGGTEENPIPEDEFIVQVLSVTNSAMYDDDMEFLLTSKTMVNGGRFGNVSDGSITRFTGATPYGNNQYGWWFGKNGSHIDGMAQIFEKPSHPYMLKNVYLQAYTDMVVTENVKMKCKVYKLDQIPDYIDGDNVALPEVPGELVVTGEALVTPQTANDKNGLITFTLYGFDEDDPELTYEYTPTIDYPIMICIEGYNDPDMEGLKDFSSFVSTDWNTDEGYGELAYLKYPINEIEYDENGDTIWMDNGRPKTYFTGEYYWSGLNNFFQGPMEMKTGLMIMIAIENPYLTFYWDSKGEYTFPDEGGLMEETIEYSDTTVVCTSIDFFSSIPSEDGDWTITWNGSDDLPAWLDITLEDVQTFETGTVVNCQVTAEPLPEGQAYREAVIRFEVPGDYKEFTFMQGVKPEPIPLRGDVNGDGEINIADINALIDIILGGTDNTEGRSDVNEDGEVNIADINAVIDIILNS